MSDFTSVYLADCSPYISALNYDIDKRHLLLECVQNIENGKPHVRIVFAGVTSYSEETVDDEDDDQCMDSVIGMHWVSERVFCLRTEKKEIVIEIENEPKIEAVA